MFAHLLQDSTPLQNVQRARNDSILTDLARNSTALTSLFSFFKAREQRHFGLRFVQGRYASGTALDTTHAPDVPLRMSYIYISPTAVSSSFSFPSSFVFPISRSRFPVHPFCARTLKSKNSLTSLAAVTPKQKNYPNEPQHIQNQRKPGPTLLLCSMLLHHACTCACHPLAPCELVREDGRSSQGVAWPRPEKWKVAGQTINKTPA